MCRRGASRFGGGGGARRENAGAAIDCAATGPWRLSLRSTKCVRFAQLERADYRFFASLPRSSRTRAAQRNATQRDATQRRWLNRGTITEPSSFSDTVSSRRTYTDKREESASYVSSECTASAQQANPPARPRTSAASFYAQQRLLHPSFENSSTAPSQKVSAVQQCRRPAHVPAHHTS